MLKSLFVGVKEKSKVKTGESELETEEIKENDEHSIQTKKTDGPSGEGREEQ